MRIISIPVIVLLLAFKLYAQVTVHKTHSFRVMDNEVKYIVDSLRSKLLSDTIKFRRSDIVRSSIGLFNKKSYSPLFIINKNFCYKLDIVPALLVKQFSNEFLEQKNIKSIYLLDGQTGFATHGEYGKNGIVLIELKQIKKVNLYVAGFKMNRKKLGGDNFGQ